MLWVSLFINVQRGDQRKGPWQQLEHRIWGKTLLCGFVIFVLFSNMIADLEWYVGGNARIPLRSDIIY